MDPQIPAQGTRRELLRRALLSGAGIALSPTLSVASLERQISLAAQATPEPGVMRQGDGEMDDLVTVAAEAYWRMLDYRKLTDFNDWSVSALTYSALVRNDDQYQPIPDLAESWEQPDPQTIIFHLRSAKFHDGTEATSEDVKFTFDSILDPDFGAPNRPLFVNIESIEAPDPKTVIMHLTAPSPGLMSFLSWVGIMPKHYAESSPDLVATQPIGTGPYRFGSTIQQTETVLEAFEEYWGGMPAFRQLKYRVIPEDTTRTVEVQTGNIDVATGIPLPDVEMMRADPNLYIVEEEPNGYNYFGFDLRRPVVSDLRVRQALAYAIDRDSINEALYAGLATKAIGPVVPSSWGFDPDVTVYEYDPERSRQLLGEAGYGDGLQLTMTSSNLPEHTQLATIITQQLADVGVQLEVTSLEFTVFTPRVLAGEYGDIVLAFGWGQGMDPLHLMYQQFYSPNQPPNGYNFVFYKNEDVDALMEEANTNLEIEVRKPAISEAQQIITAELPYVFLFHVPSFWAVRQEVQNVTAPPPMDRRFYDLAMYADRV